MGEVTLFSACLLHRQSALASRLPPQRLQLLQQGGLRCQRRPPLKHRQRESTQRGRNLGPLVHECAQHRQTLRPSVAGIRSKALRPFGVQYSDRRLPPASGPKAGSAGRRVKSTSE